MRLSNKGRYGVRALFDLALQGDGGSAQIRDIAERQQIPLRFLEQIFQDLRRAGLVSSKRGPRGGYQLTRLPGDVTLGDVLRALDAGLSSSEDEAQARGAVGIAVTEAAFRELEQRVETALDAVSLADLCERARNLRPDRSANAGYIYSI